MALTHLFQRLAAALVLSASPAHAQVSDPAAALERAGRYRDAEPFRRRAVEADRTGETESTADALEKLANNLAMQSRLADSEIHYRRALEIRVAVQSEATAKVAQSMAQIAGLMADSGDLAGAQRMSQRALNALADAGRGDSIDYAGTLSNLAGILASKGELSEAGRHYQRALSIVEKLGASADIQRSIVLNNLGANLYRIAINRNIPVAYRRDLRFRNVIQPVIFQVPDSDEATPAPARQVVLKQSETTLAAALALRERLFGIDHPDTANTANSLAVTLVALGQREAAEQLYRRALSTKRRYLQPGDRDLITGYWGLGSVVSRPEEARALFRLASSGILTAQSGYRDFGGAAIMELRSYKPVFQGQVRVNWTLANPR